MNYRYLFTKATDFLLFFIIGWYVGTQITFDLKGRRFVSQQASGRIQYLQGEIAAITSLYPAFPVDGRPLLDDWIDEIHTRIDRNGDMRGRYVQDGNRVIDRFKEGANR